MEQSCRHWNSDFDVFKGSQAVTFQWLSVELVISVLWAKFIMILWKRAPRSVLYFLKFRVRTSPRYCLKLSLLLLSPLCISHRDRGLRHLPEALGDGLCVRRRLSAHGDGHRQGPGGVRRDRVPHVRLQAGPDVLPWDDSAVVLRPAGPPAAVPVPRAAAEPGHQRRRRPRRRQQMKNVCLWPFFFLWFLLWMFAVCWLGLCFSSIYGIRYFVHIQPISIGNAQT